jgi:hypothetical protein
MLNIKKLKYDTDQILGHFGIERSINCPILNKLIDVKVPLNFCVPEILELKRQKLEIEGAMWNEEELKMHFLSILFSCADLEVPKKMKLFYERPLAAIVQGTPLNVICDALLASQYGVNTPKVPYFFLQEFKKSKKVQDDAEGQMLVAMLIAQEINKNDDPIYGCYLLGKDWYFTTLHQQNYCFSNSYDATKPQELAQIIYILQNIKNVVNL